MFTSSNYIRYLKATMEETTLFILPDIVQRIFDCFDSYKPDWSSDIGSFEYRFLNMIKEDEINSSNYKDYQKVMLILSEEIDRYNDYQNNDKIFVFFNEIEDYLLKNEKDFTIKSISEFIDSSSELNIIYKKTLFYAILKDLYDPYIYNTMAGINELKGANIGLNVDNIGPDQLDRLSSPEFYLLRPKLTYILNDCEKGNGFLYMHNAVEYYDRCASEILNDNNKDIINIKNQLNTLSNTLLKTLDDVYKAGMSINKNTNNLSNNRSNLQPLLLSNPANKNKFTGNIIKNKLVQDILSGRYNTITYSELDDELDKITEDIVLFIEDILLEDVYNIYSITDEDVKQQKIIQIIYKYMLSALNGVDKYVFRNITETDTIISEFSFDVSSDFRKAIAMYVIINQILIKEAKLSDIKDNLKNNISAFFDNSFALKSMFDKLIKKLLDSNNFERVMPE